MGQKRLPTANRASGNRLSWRRAIGACASVFLLASRIVGAEPDKHRTSHLALSPNGAIGAWLLSGPCEALRDAPPTIQPGYRGACAGSSWRTISAATGDFDWAEILGVPANTHASSAVGLWLYLEKPFDGWLLVSADGNLRVSVDGHWVHQRDRPRQRGRGFVPIALTLGPGFHPLWIGLERFGNRASFSALLRDRNTNQAPTEARLYLPGDSSERQLIEQQLALSLSVPTAQLPLELEVDLTFPASQPLQPLPVEIELQTHRWKAGSLSKARQELQPFRVHLGPLDTLVAESSSTLVVRLGNSRTIRKLWLTPSAIASLERGIRAEALPLVQTAGCSQHDDLGATLEAFRSDVAERMLQPSRDALESAVRRLDALTGQLERGENPLTKPGFADAYIRSPFNGRPTSALTYVPGDFLANSTIKRPLVVVLHGYNSNPRRILEAFLDTPTHKTAAKVDGFVLAPEAYGNTFYRGPGEHAVLDALDWATTTYPIDKTRISITGVSMGGTGAAEIAFRHSELFSAAAPLCGYHSYFVRRDTANKPLRTWERRLMHRFSPASWAESGNDIPLYVAHGTKDRPLENSKSLTTRYRALGYTLTEDWPDLGHAVWKRTYANAALYFWLAKWQKDTDPSRVVLASSSLTQGRKFWLELTAVGDSEQPSLLDARVVSPSAVEVKTRHVTAFRIGNTRHLDDDAPLHVIIDGTELLVDRHARRQFDFADGHWQLAPERSSAGTARFEGPWSELFSGPLAVVYGSLNPKTAALNREIATRLVEPRPGVALSIPVISDRQFSPTDSPLTRLIYVGRPDDHQHLAAIHASLPIHITPSSIELSALRFPEPDVGVAFVYPDPNRRGRLLGVVSGNGPEGLWRVLALPALVPDFVVFDHGTDAAAGEPVLGPDAFLRAAGFFRSDWSLPENPLDPLVPEAR